MPPNEWGAQQDYQDMAAILSDEAIVNCAAEWGVSAKICRIVQMWLVMEDTEGK